MHLTTKLCVLDANAYWAEQLFRACSRFSEVLLLKPRDLRSHFRLTGRFGGDASPRSLAPGIWEQRIPMIPGWMAGCWPWAERRLARTIRTFAAGTPVVLVLTYPQYRSLLSAVQPALGIYYNMDDYRDNWPRYSARMDDWESQIVEAADLTICIADFGTKLLCNRHPDKADRIYHLPLGCSPEFMAARDQQPHGKIPPVLASFPRPLAGYIGGLNYRFDFAFLAQVAELLPHTTFVLGGSVKEDGDAVWRAGLQHARKMSNIRFIGWVNHANLGQQLNAFDVLLMPYTDCNFNRNACPAKLWDYLGTGLPIVANTANPETLLWRNVVRIGASPSEFVTQVNDALTDDTASHREHRLAIARQHTWEALSRRLEEILVAVARNPSLPPPTLHNS